MVVATKNSDVSGINGFDKSQCGDNNSGGDV